MIRRTDEPFLKGEECASVLNYQFMRDLLVAWLTTILEVNEGHDDTRPDSLVVWLLLHLTHEFKQAFAQGNEIRLRQAHSCPQEHDLPALPGFLGDTRRGNIGPCGLKHGTEKLSVLKRGRLVAGWLRRLSVHPFDFAPRKAAVLRNLNQPGLFELGQVVVQPVRCHAGPFCQFFGGLGSPTDIRAVESSWGPPAPDAPIAVQDVDASSYIVVYSNQ